jgi:hypothetical protein
VRQVLAQDRRRPARPTARTTSSMEDRSALRNPAGASAILATTRRTVLKGSSHTPTLVAASNSAALIRSRRSAAGRRTNLRRRLAPDLNESLVSQPGHPPSRGRGGGWLPPRRGRSRPAPWSPRRSNAFKSSPSWAQTLPHRCSTSFER